MLTLIFDEAATTFGQDYHPECPTRLINTEAYLLDKRPTWCWVQPRLATEQEILRVHRPNHLERLRQPMDFDADTPYYPGIEDHARRSAGAALDAVDQALRGKKAFSLMRPPGHHATSTRAMGFCYLNSIAIAAHYALAIGCERVGIWDFDAHHGNGTEEIVFGNNRIRFASIHQYPGYPGSGTASRGNVCNWPIPPQSEAREHASAVLRALDWLVEFSPDLLLVSAGFDAFVGDPLTEMTLEPEHFESFGRQLKETGLPAAPILEGGYSDYLPVLVEAFLAGWSD
ncbi:MAG: histone deacetylase [Verrucomicrobia bacterium]|nr:histone deacetylase [Verrucomicrobiota bacterium]MBV8532718.1 histone deacetylase [Verrucomicrobiota bacterium]